MSRPEEAAEKVHDPTPRKLEEARKRGEIARSTDLSVAAGYGGFVLAALAFGAAALTGTGEVLSMALARADTLSDQVFASGGPLARWLGAAIVPLAPLVLIPAVAVIAALLAQRGIVFAPSKLSPKLQRVSPIANARNKFGRDGIFEFAKSFVKLAIYSGVLAAFLAYKLDAVMAGLQGSAMQAAGRMLSLCVELMLLVLLIATIIGVIDLAWQRASHLRKNRMSRKELADEQKETDGDPQMRQQRRQRAQEVALNQMMADVPGADVVIVNPTHVAVALRWSRKRGDAPVCVAKGVDHVALRIRETAHAAAVPVHHDPPTARALYASVEIGHEIDRTQYRAVAAAIRFAENMRRRARAGR